MREIGKWHGEKDLLTGVQAARSYSVETSAMMSLRHSAECLGKKQKRAPPTNSTHGNKIVSRWLDIGAAKVAG